MRWIKIKTKDDLPKEKGIYFVKDKLGINCIFHFDNFSAHIYNWLKNVDSWLDESQPSFTLENMKDCWDASYTYYQEVFTAQNITQPNQEQYFKQEYNIDL